MRPTTTTTTTTLEAVEQGDKKWYLLAKKQI
jgi:hypothetical protein